MRGFTWTVLVLVILLVISVEGFQHWDCVGDALKFAGPCAACIGAPNPMACIGAIAGAVSFLQGCCASVQHGTTPIVTQLRQACIAIGIDK